MAASVAYENYVAGIEGILQQAAPARTQLTVAVRSVQPTCGPAVAPAEQQVSTVVANRTGLIQQLDALGPAPDPATRAAASLLHQALAASAQADAAYQGWIAARASSGSDTCATDPASAATLASAQAADSSATALKTQFVASFDPLAGQIGLPSWSPSDF